MILDRANMNSLLHTICCLLLYCVSGTFSAHVLSVFERYIPKLYNHWVMMSNEATNTHKERLKCLKTEFRLAYSVLIN